MEILGVIVIGGLIQSVIVHLFSCNVGYTLSVHAGIR